MIIQGMALALLALGAALGVQTLRLSAAHQQLASQDLQAVEARADALHTGVIELNRRLAAQQEAANAAQSKARRAAADAAAANAAAGGLRAYAADLAASAAACHSAPAAVSPAASAPGLVLAELLGRVESRGRELAAEADRRGIAGSECEQRYEALTR